MRFQSGQILFVLASLDDFSPACRIIHLILSGKDSIPRLCFVQTWSPYEFQDYWDSPIYRQKPNAQERRRARYTEGEETQRKCPSGKSRKAR